MKKIMTLLLAAFSSVLVMAQPAPVKKAAGSVFTLTTFAKDGTLKASTHGFFVGADGVGVSSWTPFVNAASAVIVDANGKKYDVQAVIGANELYDVCKFRVNVKATPLNMSPAHATKGAKMWAVSFSDGKPLAKAVDLARTETFMQKYAYYVFDGKVAENLYGCPVVNDKGLLLGILQSASDGSEVHATDVAFTDTIHTTGLSISDQLLRQTQLCVDIPRDKDQASVMLMMASDQADSVKYLKYAENFISVYPEAADGYVAKAQALMTRGDYDGAAGVMQAAVGKVSDKAEAHAEWSRLMYQKLVFSPDSTFTKWTLDDALAEAQTAYSIDPQPAYKHREAQVVYSKGDYAKAYDMFMALTSTKLRNAELFYEAAQSKTQLNAPSAEVIALLDSAIAVCPKPLTSIAAPYVLARGRLLDEAGELRKALHDYNVYDTLMVGRADDAFYYTRYQCEMKVKQYQQALNDIAHAAYINPGQAIYLAELASLQLRVNRFEDAVKAADLCLQVAPESSDSYIIKGLALIQMKKKNEGLQALQKAKELGDARAEGLIKKYK